MAGQRIVDLMVSVVNAEIERCPNLTKFCVNHGSKCPRHTRVETCCTIDTGDPNCVTCVDCFENTFAMLSKVLQATVDERLVESVTEKSVAPKRPVPTPPKGPRPRK